jgi:hypothetical protein
MLFALCRWTAALLLPFSPARSQCTDCTWTYTYHYIEARQNDECYAEYEEVTAYYCGYYEYVDYYYVGYYCRED